MAFMDKLSEKLTSGANAVQNSTRKVTEQVRINGEISTNANEIDKRMKQIGVCVKSRLMSQISDPEVERLAREIDELTQKNQQLAEELESIKGIRHCVNCGAELKANALFCQRCGTKNDPAVQQTQSQSAQPHKTVSVRPVTMTGKAQPVSPASPTMQTAAASGFTEYNSGSASAPVQTSEDAVQDYSQFRPAPEAKPTEEDYSQFQPVTESRDEQPEQAEEAKQPVQQEVPISAFEHSESLPINSCPYCGCTKNLGKFCPSCGKKLN